MHTIGGRRSAGSTYRVRDARVVVRAADRAGRVPLLRRIGRAIVRLLFLARLALVAHVARPEPVLAPDRARLVRWLVKNVGLERPAILPPRGLEDFVADRRRRRAALLLYRGERGLHLGAHRRAIGVPETAEIGEDELLWLETGADLLGGVSFTKGCYVGQENTARMHHRDKVRRRLVPVTLAGDRGDGVVRDAAGRSAGTLRGAIVAGRGFAHLRLDAAAAPLFVGDTPIGVHVPAWLALALAPESGS